LLVRVQPEVFIVVDLVAAVSQRLEEAAAHHAGVAKQFDYPQDFADAMFSRVEAALR
jgi:hypothetical protein